jgi:hypothetical protein
MYVIIFAVIISIIFIFYDTLFNLTQQVQNSKIGSIEIMIWFYGLLILNVIVMISIHIHKYYIETYQLSGNRGPRGYDGRQGENGQSVCTKTY